MGIPQTTGEGAKSTTIDSGKFMAARAPSKKPPVLTCLSFSGWDEEEVKPIVQSLRIMAAKDPGAFCRGEQRFPNEPEDQRRFFVLSGFSEEDAALLAGDDYISKRESFASHLGAVMGEKCVIGIIKT